MASKKVVISVAGIALAVFVVAGVVSGLAWKKKRVNTLKAGDAVSFPFVASTIEPALCVAKGNTLVISGKILEIDSEKQTARCTWDTLTNPAPQTGNTVSGSTCKEGSAPAVWHVADNADEGWKSGFFGQPPSYPVMAEVLLDIPLSKLKKL